ncbi:MAG TPA: tetratricopeptide repeat protein [Acidobacteriota bacterium]
MIRRAATALVLLAAVAVPTALLRAQQDPEAALRLFADAERLAAAGDLQAALRNWELLVQQFGGADIADDALLRVAEGRWALGDIDAARLAIASLKQDYARTPGAAGAFVLDGRLRVATGRSSEDLVAAREAFRNVVLLFGRADYPGLAWRAEALVRAGEVSVLLGEPQAAAAAFLAAVEDEPDSGWTPAARLQLATVLMRSGDWAPGAEILQRLIDEHGGAEGEAGEAGAVAAAARRRLELGFRLLSRPARGQQPWSGARQVRISGPQLDEPVGIDASEDNRLVIVDPGLPLIAVVEADGTLSHRVPSSEAHHPWWAAPGATPYVATRRSVLMPVSRERQEFARPENNEMKPVEQIVAGGRGIFRQWLLVDANRRQVLLFDEGGGFLSMVMGGDDSEPVDVAVDHLGRFYVLDRRAEAVYRFNAAAGERTRVVQRDWRRPEAIAVDALGNIYVLDRDARTIDVFDAGGAHRWQLGPQLPGGIELRSPRDLAVDGSGRIYVADRDLKAFLEVE